MWVSKPIVLSDNPFEFHLKKKGEKASICGSEIGTATPELMDVNCIICLEAVIVKRLFEISAIERARTNKKSIRELGDVSYNDLLIRKLLIRK